MATVGASMPFIKTLAASDSRARTKALDTLKAFLSTKYGHTSARMSYKEAHTMWAGLYYALWMTDRAPAQHRLCDELGGLAAAVGLSDASMAMWFRAFWEVMSREWTTSIDVLRMDKFMALVRRVLKGQLAWMGQVAEKTTERESHASRENRKNRKNKRSAENAKADGGAAALAAGLALLAEWPLNVEAEMTIDVDGGDGRNGDSDNEGDDGSDSDERPAKRAKRADPTSTTRKEKKEEKAKRAIRIPVGLTAHVLDIWVDEVERLGLLPTEEGKEGKEGKKDREDTGDKKDGSKDSTVDEDSLVFRVNELVQALAAKTAAPAVRKHAKEALEDERLPWNRKDSEDKDEKGEGDNDENDDEPDQGGDWDGFQD